MTIDILGYLKSRNGWVSVPLRKAEERKHLRRARASIMDWATKAYSGTEGCACGCLGTYYNLGDSPNDTKQFNRIARRVMAGINGDEPTDWMHVWEDGAAVQYGQRSYMLHRN